MNASFSSLVRALALIMALVACCTHARAQSTAAALGDTTTITVRAAARVPADQPLLLGSIADIAGPNRDQLASVVLVADTATLTAPAGQASRIDIAQVRKALEDARINLGTVVLSGQACAVRIGERPAPPVESAPAPTADPSVPTVRGAVEAQLMRVLGEKPQDVRITFDNAQELLDVPTSGRTVAAQPMGKGDRIPVQVRVFEGDRVVAAGTVRVGVQVRREVLVASREVARGAPIPESSILREERWVSPSITPATPADLAGGTPLAKINAAEIIQTRHLQSPIAVRRGDVVMVDCLSGGFIITTKARAKRDARIGEVIEFAALTGKRSITGRVSAPGRATIVIESGPRGETPQHESNTPAETTP